MKSIRTKSRTKLRTKSRTKLRTKSRNKLRTKLRGKSRTKLRGKSRTKLRGKSRTKLRGKSKKLHQTGGASLRRKKKQTHSVDILNILSTDLKEHINNTNLFTDYIATNVANPRLYVHKTNYPKIWLHLDEKIIRRSGFFYELSDLTKNKPILNLLLKVIDI